MFHIDVIFKYKTKYCFLWRKWQNCLWFQRDQNVSVKRKGTNIGKKKKNQQVTGKSRKHLLACLGLLDTSRAILRFGLRQAIEHIIVKCFSSTLTLFFLPLVNRIVQDIYSLVLSSPLTPREMASFYLLLSTVIAEWVLMLCVPLLHDSPFLQVMVVECCPKSRGFWGWYLMVGKSCLRPPTVAVWKCVQTALVMHCSLFQAFFPQKSWDF